METRVLKNAPLSFRYNVIRHGEPIVLADDNLRCDFMEATLSHHFDFAPFRTMYLKEHWVLEYNPDRVRKITGHLRIIPKGNWELFRP